MSETAALSDLPFEKALAELETIVKELESGQPPLEKSIDLYTRGEALKKHCEQLLVNAEMRISKIMVGADGKPRGVAPLDGRD